MKLCYALLAAMLATTAQASTFSFTFDENPACAENTCFNYRTGETGSGSLTLADSNLTGVGAESRQLSALTGATFNFSLTIIPNFFGVTFTTAGMNDPTFHFTDGVLSGMDFSVVNPTFQDTLTVNGLNYEHRDANNHYSAPSTLEGQLTIDQRGTISITTVTPFQSPVPEPSSIFLLASGAAAVAFARRRK
jgi:hypothetical protein